MLKGPAAYAVELLQPQRLLLTCAYFVTLGRTQKRGQKWTADSTRAADAVVVVVVVRVYAVQLSGAGGLCVCRAECALAVTHAGLVRTVCVP